MFKTLIQFRGIWSYFITLCIICSFLVCQWWPHNCVVPRMGNHLNIPVAYHSQCLELKWAQVELNSLGPQHGLCEPTMIQQTGIKPPWMAYGTQNGTRQMSQPSCYPPHQQRVYGRSVVHHAVTLFFVSSPTVHRGSHTSYFSSNVQHQLSSATRHTNSVVTTPQITPL